MFEYILVAALVVLAGFWLVHRFLRGKKSGVCGCAGCSGCAVSSRSGSAASASSGCSGCAASGAAVSACAASDCTAPAISLRKLAEGQRAVIVEVSAQGELGRRIRDMGLVPGAEVAVVGRAPLKDPVALRLKGFTLSLRNNEADFISVRPQN